MFVYHSVCLYVYQKWVPCAALICVPHQFSVACPTSMICELWLKSWKFIVLYNLFFNALGHWKTISNVCIYMHQRGRYKKKWELRMPFYIFRDLLCVIIICHHIKAAKLTRTKSWRTIRLSVSKLFMNGALKQCSSWTGADWRVLSVAVDWEFISVQFIIVQLCICACVYVRMTLCAMCVYVDDLMRSHFTICVIYAR